MIAMKILILLSMFISGGMFGRAAAKTGRWDVFVYGLLYAMLMFVWGAL